MIPGRFVGFGEILLRLEAGPPRRLVQEEKLVARYTRSEADIAVMLAGLGIETRAVSRVPYVELGTGISPTGAIYDRGHSGFATLDPRGRWRKGSARPVHGECGQASTATTARHFGAAIPCGTP